MSELCSEDQQVGPGEQGHQAGESSQALENRKEAAAPTVEGEVGQAMKWGQKDQLRAGQFMTGPVMMKGAKSSE